MIREKVKTGIVGLDEMLEGGLIPGRPYVVAGASGTGKTTLAMQFLLEGARAGEDVMYVALDEPPNEVKSNLSAFGWDLGKVRVFDATCDIMGIDKTPVRDVSTERKVVSFAQVSNSIRRTSDKGPADVTINTLQELLKQEMRITKYSRVVIDSVTSLRFFYIKTSEEYAAVQSFFRLMSDLGITSILTVHLAEVSKMDAESHIARGEIRLHKWFNGRGLVRGITIEKYRGSTHDTKMRLMKIDSDGISVRMMVPQKNAETCGPEGETVGTQVTPSVEIVIPPPPAPPNKVLPPPPGSMPGAESIDSVTKYPEGNRSGGA
jgi:KaiC/GvpD/RAD55 family RecA-like ATPase